MNKKQEPVSPVIPNDYCIMKLKVVEGDITEIGVTKVRNNTTITVYATDIESTIEDIGKAISRVFEIIGNDTIFYLNNETEVDLLKNKCESMQIPITNELLNGNKVLKDIGIHKRRFICNVLEVATKI